MIFESGDENSEPPPSYLFLRGRNHDQDPLDTRKHGFSRADVPMKRERSQPVPSALSQSDRRVSVSPSKEKPFLSKAVPFHMTFPSP